MGAKRNASDSNACLLASSQDLQDLPASCTRRDNAQSFPTPALAIALNTVRERTMAIGYQAARPRSTARLTCQTMAMGVLGMRHNEWEVGGEEGLCQAPPLCEGSEEPLGKYPIGQSF
jgi:hypothetical protein